MDLERATDELPKLVIVDSTGSTNDDVMELARSGAPNGTCIAAYKQTNGRGRRGHGWASSQGGLYLSVVLRPDVPMSHMMGLSAVCGLGILEALREAGATATQLKWPNDVVVVRNSSSAKLCGLLMEAGTSPEGMFAVAGVGINLQQVQLKDEMGSINPLPAISLIEALGAEKPLPSFENLAASVRSHVVERTHGWQSAIANGHGVAGPLAPVLSDYFDALYLVGEPVDVIYPNGNLMSHGTFAGVDVWGRATIRKNDGSEIAISSEQASLRARI